MKNYNIERKRYERKKLMKIFSKIEKRGMKSFSNVFLVWQKACPVGKLVKIKLGSNGLRDVLAYF